MLHGHSAAQQSSISLHAVEGLRIGALDRPMYTLTEVGGISIGPNGTIFVAQPREHNIKVYDSSGRFLQILGRQGGGPGEFSSILQMGWLADTLWVTDPAASRVSKFSRQGQVISTQRIEGPLLPSVGRPLTPAALLPGNRLITSALMGATGAGAKSQEVILEMSPTGTISGGYGARDFTGALTRVVVGTRSVQFVQPFRNLPLYAVAPRGSHVVVLDQRAPLSASADSFRITSLRSPGDTIFSLPFTFRPTRTPPALRDSIVQARRESLSRLGASPRVISRILDDSLRVPDFLPVVQQLLTSDDGRTLLGHADTGTGVVEWTILSRTGQLAGRFTTPSGVRLLAFTEDRYWGVVKDDLGVSNVVRYQVRSSSPSRN